MSSKYVIPALFSLLLMGACGNKVDETVVSNIQDLSGKVDTGKSEMAPLSEKTQALVSKLQLVPLDVQAKKEFVDFYKFAKAVTTKKELMEASYNELQTQLSDIEENYRSGKVKKEEITAELSNINAQIEGIRYSVPKIMHISDSLSGAYDQMAAGATGTPQPVTLSDAGGMLAPNAAPGALAAPAPGAAATMSPTDGAKSGSGGATSPLGSGTAPAANDAKKLPSEKDGTIKTGKKSETSIINQ